MARASGAEKQADNTNPWLRLRYIRIGRFGIDWHPALWRRFYLYLKVPGLWVFAIGPLRIEVRAW